MTRTHRTLIVAVAVAAIVAAANASDGAYFSQSWGWVALAFLVPTTVLLILDRVAVPGRLRIAFASLDRRARACGSRCPRSGRSARRRPCARSSACSSTSRVALAVALVLRRGDGPGVARRRAGRHRPHVSAYGLATRLFPDRFDAYDDPINTYRLAEPLGYWNALGLLSAMGLVLAVGVVAHARRASVGRSPRPPRFPCWL